MKIINYQGLKEESHCFVPSILLTFWLLFLLGKFFEASFEIVLFRNKMKLARKTMYLFVPQPQGHFQEPADAAHIKPLVCNCVDPESDR